MKTRFRYVVCAIVTLMMCSCSKDYKNVIPADSDAVVMINLMRVADKADLAHSRAIGLAKENMGIVVNPKDKGKAMGYLDDPSKIGIDFREPACLFHRADGSYGLVMKVGDDGDLENFLAVLRGNGVVSKTTERDGVKCCKLLDEVALLYDSRAVMLYANSMMSAGEKDMRAALALMKQDEDMSYKSTYTFASDADDKDIVLMSNNMRRGLQDVLPKDTPLPFLSALGDMASFVSVDFTDGKIAVETELLPESEKDKAVMKEMDEKLHKINGIFNGYDLSCQDTPVWAYMGMDGKWLLSKLKDNSACKEYLFMLERCIDIEQMIAAVDGDMVVAMSPNREHSYTAVAQVKNTDFMKDVDYWMQDMKEYGASMNRVSATDYCLNAGGAVRLFWGLKNNNLYLSTIGRPEHESGTMIRHIVKNDDITDYWLYAYIGGSALPADSQPQMLGMRMAGFESVVIKSKSFGKMSIDVNMKDKSQNVLKGLLD